MVLELLHKQRSAIDVFFDNIDASIIESMMDKLIEKRQAGKVIYWSGVGKSYNIASHSADMIKSMGFTSFPLKPVEALHGDMGALNDGDIVIIYSKSGNTQELMSFMMHLNKMDVEVYGVFCNEKAKLAKYCDRTIILPCGKELDNDFDLVPTTSILVFILFVNLLVSYYLKSQQVNIFQYGKNHPSGNIGQRIWFVVKDIMYNLDDICIIKPSTKLVDCMLSMTGCRTGYAIIVDKDENIVGIVSDGDIRRHLTQKTDNVDLNILVDELMNKCPTTICQDTRVIDMMETVNNNKALSVGMPVVDHNNKFVGYIDNKILVRYGSIF